MSLKSTLTLAIIASICWTQIPALALAASEKSWVKLQGEATDNLDANKYWLAEPMLQQAVVQAGAFGGNDLRLAKSLGELGRLYTIRGRFDRAEPYLEEELRIKESALGTGEGQCIPAIGSLIRFYLMHGTARKADPMTNEVLSFVEGKLDEQNAHPVTMKVRKGQALEGWAGTAAPVMRNPLIEWAITCDELGNIYRARHNYPLADRLFKAALDVKATVLGKDHLSLANSYDSLGLLCLDSGQKEQAESYLKDALRTTERILPPDSPEVYSRMDKLAKCYIKSGKHRQAEELYLRAQDLWKGQDTKNGDAARALFALGSLYVEEKKYASAAPVLAHALHLAEQFNGPLSIGLVPYLEKYAYTLYYLGRRSETDYLRSRANTISGEGS